MWGVLSWGRGLSIFTSFIPLQAMIFGLLVRILTRRNWRFSECSSLGVKPLTFRKIVSILNNWLSCKRPAGERLSIIFSSCVRAVFLSKPCFRHHIDDEIVFYDICHNSKSFFLVFFLINFFSAASRKHRETNGNLPYNGAFLSGKATTSLVRRWWHFATR